MRFQIEVGAPLFAEKGPRQGTTEIKFRGSAFLEPDELEDYYARGLMVNIAKPEAVTGVPFEDDTREALAIFELKAGDEVELIEAGEATGRYRVTGWSKETGELELEHVLDLERISDADSPV